MTPGVVPDARSARLDAGSVFQRFAHRDRQYSVRVIAKW